MEKRSSDQLPNDFPARLLSGGDNLGQRCLRKRAWGNRAGFRFGVWQRNLNSDRASASLGACVVAPLDEIGGALNIRVNPCA